MTQQDISELIMTRFKDTNSKPNHIIDQRWISFNLLTRLDPKEKGLVEPAIQDLLNQGFITIDNRVGQRCLVLTQDGFDCIYSIDKNQTIEKIQTEILSRFRQQNSRPNHIIQARWILQNLSPKLNPKERELISEAIQGLIDKGYVMFDNKNGVETIVLQQAGFNILY